MVDKTYNVLFICRQLGSVDSGPGAIEPRWVRSVQDVPRAAIRQGRQLLRTGRRLAPLVQREIMVRLLRGAHGSQLLQLATEGSPSQQIFKAVVWLKQNFARPLRMGDLADRVGMSPSTFRQHFRSVTGTSPLQYQKTLRLHEARQLMLSEHVDAGSAGGRVGYESASQFSREYSRLFGAPPQQDVKRLRIG